MPSTLVGAQFVPEIASAVATAEFPGMLALTAAGMPFVTTFPDSTRLGAEGDTVKFPRYDALTDMEAMTEDVALTPEALVSSMDEATVQQFGKAAEISDFADLAARGDASTELGRQFARLAARRIDAALVTEAETTDLVETTVAVFTWNAFIDAIVGKWGDEAFTNVGGMIVHSKVAGDISKDADFKQADRHGGLNALRTGFIGSIGNVPVYVSDRITTAAGPTYNNLILKRNALGLEFQRDLFVESDRDILKKSTVVAGDIRAAVHLYYAVKTPAIRWNTQ